MSGLRAVLEDHDWLTPRGYAWPCCTCGEEFPDGEEAAYAHVEAAVLDWLRARLASDEVREAVARSICGNDREHWWPRYEDLYRADADAALAAVVDALGVEGA